MAGTPNGGVPSADSNDLVTVGDQINAQPSITLNDHRSYLLVRLVITSTSCFANEENIISNWPIAFSLSSPSSAFL